MPSCDDCGLVFENVHDLQRHVKRWCPENRERKGDVATIEVDESNVTPFKPEQKENDDREHEVMTRAKEDNEKLWDQKYDKYIKDGLSREDVISVWYIL